MMKEAEQYTEMAQLALGQGLPGEAQAIIEKGLQKGSSRTRARRIAPRACSARPRWP